MATPTLLSAQDLSTAGIVARWDDQLHEIADIGSKDPYGVRVEVFLHEPGGWWCYWVPLEEVTRYKCTRYKLLNLYGPEGQLLIIIIRPMLIINRPADADY